MSVLTCPVCGAPLVPEEKSLHCENGHRFDLAKEGYVNLLLGSKPGALRGDSKESAHARRVFLDKGYYACLKNAMNQRLAGAVLDICCGEGYYDTYDGPLYGFDISKEMVRLAAKRNKAANYHYFVANLSHIPVEDHCIDTAMHLFAPFNEEEFSRILKPDGVLYSVIPGENHLFEMKEVLYSTPYKNDEQAPHTTGILHLIGKEKVSEKVHISGEDLWTLFSMTPYFYRTSEEDKAKLRNIQEMELTVEFVILEYRA